LKCVLARYGVAPVLFFRRTKPGPGDAALSRCIAAGRGSFPLGSPKISAYINGGGH